MQPRVLFLGKVNYSDTFAWMKEFTRTRRKDTCDEFWILSHPAVFTQGTSCEAQPMSSAKNIPLVKTDRGGQMTYHGPGQLIVYLLLDIKRLGIGPKRLVKRIEFGIIDLLDQLDIHAETRPGAPGVYVAEEKIAALGLRIRQGACYHGLSLNIDMDLSPFNLIDPCGYAGLKVTQLSALGVSRPESQITDQLIDCLTDSIYSPIDSEVRA